LKSVAPPVCGRAGKAKRVKLAKQMSDSAAMLVQFRFASMVSSKVHFFCMGYRNFSIQT
jgi:hypothetical protein